VDYIGRKVSSRLGMLRRARMVISRESCITLYNAMVLPIFDFVPLYGTPVAGPIATT